MHVWGDDWFEEHGDRLCDAGDRLRSLSRRFRIGGQIKEKFGTLRFYANFHSMIHDLIWPGYVYNQYPYKWMWSLDLEITNGRRSYIYYWLVQRWVLTVQFWGYRFCYKKLVKEFPEIREEILFGADYYKEFLVGL